MQYPRIRISDASKHVGESVSIPGWLYNLRKSGKICFPLLRDGSGIMQCVAVKAAVPEELFETLKGLTQESAIILSGKIRAEERAPGGYEMDLESAEAFEFAATDTVVVECEENSGQTQSILSRIAGMAPGARLFCCWWCGGPGSTRPGWSTGSIPARARCG